MLSSYINYGIRKRRHKVLCKIPKLIVLSEAAKKEITSLNLHVNDDQLLVIPDPLFVSKDSEQISSLKNKNVIFVGRLSQEKGVMRLLRIWQTVCKSLDGYNLYIYGEGNAIDEMQQYIKDNKLDNNVVFKGYCQDISQIYLNADLLCMTSDTEGFGMVLIESMYYGVPCISFDCPTSPKEIINNAGVVVPCFDEEKYAYEIVSLLSNSDRMKSLQQNGIKRARHFYINKIVARWIEVCKE